MAVHYATGVAVDLTPPAQGETEAAAPPVRKTLEQMYGTPNRAQRRAKKAKRQGRSRRITAVSRNNPRAHEIS